VNKKKQKNFEPLQFPAPCSRGKAGDYEIDKAGMPKGQRIKVFLLLFVHKKKNSSFYFISLPHTEAESPGSRQQAL
jgi:hypothetical protein